MVFNGIYCRILTLEHKQKNLFENYFNIYLCNLQIFKFINLTKILLI